MSDRYENANSQSPGTVYDWVARNAIDLLLVDADDRDYKAGKSYFFRQVTTHPAFAYEIFAVKGGNLAAGSAVTLQLSSNVQSTVPFPDVPDFITSCYLQTQLPAILGVYKSTNQNTALTTWHDYTIAATSTLSTIPASASGAQEFAAVTTNDECDPTNSSLSYSGLTDVPTAPSAGTAIKGAITAIVIADASGALTAGSRNSNTEFTLATSGDGYGLVLGCTAEASTTDVNYSIQDGGFNYAVGDTVTVTDTAASKDQVITVTAVQPRGEAFGDLVFDASNAGLHVAGTGVLKWQVGDVLQLSPASASSVVTIPSGGKSTYVEIVVTSVGGLESATLGKYITGFRTKDSASSTATGVVNGGTGFQAGTTLSITKITNKDASGAVLLTTASTGSGTPAISASESFTVAAAPSFRRSFNCVPPMEAVSSEYGWDFVSHAAQDTSKIAAKNRDDANMAQPGALLPMWSDADASSNKGRYNKNTVSAAGVETINSSFSAGQAPKGARALVNGHYAHWVRGAGLRMVERAKFYSDSGTYDQHDFMTLYAFEELIGHEGKRSQYLNNMNPQNREELIRQSLSAQDVYVRLPFFFTLSYQCSLENVATLLATFKIDFSFAALQRLIVRSSPAVEVNKGTALSIAEAEPTSVIVSEKQGSDGSWRNNPHTNCPHGTKANGAISELALDVFVLLGAVYMNQNMRENSASNADQSAMLSSVYGISGDLSARISQAIASLAAASPGNKAAAQAELEQLLKGYDSRLAGDQGGINAQANSGSGSRQSGTRMVQQVIAGQPQFDSAGQPVMVEEQILEGVSRYGAGGSVSESRRKLGAISQSQQAFGQKLSAYSIVSDNERVKPYIQTLHKSIHVDAAKLKASTVSLRIIGSHPLIELIVCIQHDQNALSNNWTNLSTQIDQNWYAPGKTGNTDATEGIGLSNVGPYGYVYDSAGPDVNPNAAAGPMATIKLSANANARHSRAPGSHFSRLVPHIMHSNSPDEQSGAYFYAIPIALFPESCVEWTGSLNQGRLTELELQFAADSSMQRDNVSATAHIIARTWNVESIKDDMGGPKYANTMTVEVK